MVWLFVLQVALGLASDLIDYKLHKNFGEVFEDYSGNYLYAVNGVSSQVEPEDTIATDRGAYFSVGNSVITLPPNDITSNFLVPPQFSIVAWILVEDYTFYIFYCKTPSSLLYIRRYSIESNLAVYLSSQSFTVPELPTTANSFNIRNLYLEQWNLIVLSIATSIKLSINNTPCIIYTLPSSFTMNSLTSCVIGRKDSITSLVGYLWSFTFVNTEVTYSDYLGPASTTCLIPGCSSCSYSLIEGNSTGCVPIVASPLQSSLSQACTNCTGGCNANTCLTCSVCLTNSCELSGGQILCACPPGSTATTTTCLCGPGTYFNGTECLNCPIDCATCSNSSTCTSCISQNASPAPKGCLCKSGYYNSSSLTTLNSCMSCGSKCSKCDANGNCVQCTNPTASLSLNCLCPSGTFEGSNTCQSCYSECSECSSFGQCISCKATFAVSSSFGCDCLEGYGGTVILSSVNSCVKCMDICSTCINSNSCESCKDPNAVASGIGCSCKSGYFLNGDCEPCSVDCKSCNLTHCLECWDSLAEVNGTQCFCPNGTFQVRETNVTCQACRQDCKTCSDSLTCDECLIRGAVKQSQGCGCETGFYSNSTDCIKCDTWNDEQNTCVFCVNGSYFLKGICENCPDLCTGCVIDECLDCVKNAQVVNGSCVCLNDFVGSAECELKIFEAEVKVDASNNLLISFSLELMEPLSAGDLSISLPSIEFLYDVSNFNSRSCKVTMKYQSSFSGTVAGTVEIDSKVVSVYNSTLVSNVLQVQIYEAAGTSQNSTLNSTLTQTGKNGLYVAMSITLFLSLFSFNFVSFWNFLNTIQILIYIRLFNISLPAKFDILLSSLRESTQVFNVFKYFVSQQQLAKLEGRLYEFGFTTTGLFFNAGSLMTLLLIIFGNNAFVVVLSKLTALRGFSSGIYKKVIDKLLGNFKYNAYIRYLIQSYLDYGVASLIALINFNVNTVTEVANYTLSAFVFILISLMPINTLFFINKHKQEINEHNAALLKHYGSLFYEISNDRGLLATYFYFFFFLKRLAFIIILFSLQNYPLMQLLMCLILNVSVIFIQYTIYLYYFRPFSEKLISNANTLCESLICIIVFLLAMNQIIQSQSMFENSDNILLGILYTIFVVQTLTPLVVLGQNLWFKFRLLVSSKNKVLPSPSVKVTSEQISSNENKSDLKVYAWQDV